MLIYCSDKLMFWNNNKHLDLYGTCSEHRTLCDVMLYRWRYRLSREEGCTKRGERKDVGNENARIKKALQHLIRLIAVTIITP